jgi:hypothetical protein
VKDITIKNVMPKAALPGGEVIIEYSGLELAGTSQPEVRFGDFNAQVTMASNDHIIAKVPESSAETGTSDLIVSLRSWEKAGLESPSGRKSCNRHRRQHLCHLQRAPRAENSGLDI